MGLWHGANWTFVFWGLYHAVFIFLYRLLAITLLLSMLAWIPFRAQSLDDAGALYLRLFYWANYLWLGLRENAYLVAAVLLIGFLSCYMAVSLYKRVNKSAKSLFMVLDTAILGAVLATLFVFLRPVNQFIYFQF